MGALPQEIDFGQPRAKLGITSQELEVLDRDGQSIISKDSNPGDDDDHDQEEYYNENNLTSKI